MLLRRLSIAGALILSLGSSVVLLSQNSVLAQMPDDSGDVFSGKRKGGMMKELGLTPDQMQKIQAIHTKYKPDMEAKGKALKTAMEEMRTLMKNSSSSKDQLKTQQRKVQTAHNDMMNLKFDSMLEVREILTPEQRTKFTQMMQDKKGKFGDHPGGHRGNK